ncbi:MAG TPA: carbohydrate kinase, partial [Prevotellaceae bacterium]|nr:carbohydrate kinase [Prevotellaceae bacterium]
GDNFNAGLACSLIWRGITRDRLPLLGREEWQHMLATACAFSGDACRRLDNYISPGFGLRASSLPV